MTAREKKLKLFAEGRKEQEAEKKKKENQKSYTKEYDKLAYTIVKQDDWSLVRFVGSELPPNSSQRESTGWKEILRSYIVNDEGKGFYCNWSPDRNWLLWKVYNKIMEYDWDDDKPKGQQKVYKNIDKFPSLYKRCRYNGKEKENRVQWENGWWPTKHLISNILDRLDYEWHVKNKHYKLITKKATEKDGNVFYEPGLPPSIYYEHLSPRIIEKYGFLEDYDVGIRKIKGKDGVVYDVQHSKFLADEKELENCICKDLLTEEELTWEKYNLDKYFRVTTYQKIKNHLGVFIQGADKLMGTNFYVELEKLVADEKKLFDELYGNNEEYDTVLPEEETEKVEEKKEDIQLTFEYDEVAPFVKDLDDYSKKLIRGINGKKIVFIDEAGNENDFPSCPKCQNFQPKEIDKFCIYCGEKF